MKTIFDTQNRAEIISRIAKITADNQSQWGKMNVFQMLQHNVLWNEWILGKDDTPNKQTFWGKIFGKMALRKMIKYEKPFDRNIPTSNQHKPAVESGNLEEEKQKWISLTEDYASYQNPDFIHDFFGKMTKEEIGILVYKHCDHHLRQFGA